MLNTDVYSDELYASGVWRRARRALELGWRYYTWDLLRYLTQRRAFGLNIFDWQAATNPILETFDRKHASTQLPDGYHEALGQLHAAGARLTLPPSRVCALLNCWQHACRAMGDVIECGSYRGATALLIALLGEIQGRRQKVMILDTFSGSPAGVEIDSLRTKREYILPGGYPDLLRQQAEQLGVAGRVEIHTGTFNETFEKLATKALSFSFAHIDANLFQSTWDACRFVIPRIVSGGAVVFDDYHGPCDLGARLAIDRYFANSHARPRRLAGSSAWLSVAQDSPDLLARAHSQMRASAVK